ncbi:MAG: OprD family porin [Paraglaciecola sp.]|nr:OprD family porin [Paraglaciecola sp.]
MPGLSSTLRYIKSHGARVGSVTNCEGFEHDLDLTYSIQQGVLKCLSFRLRNVTARANYRTYVDEKRLILQNNLTFN